MAGKTHVLPSAFILFLSMILIAPFQAQVAGDVVPPTSATLIPQAQQIEPAALLALLKAGGKDKPLVLQVGSRVMFAQAHIVGSKFAGPGSQADGLQLLASKVASLPKSAPMVIYCGCCPWPRCPNMEPAFAKLHTMGFTNVKALYLANNFGADWVNKGYPVEKGE